MDKVITISREDLKKNLDQFIDNKPEHVFIMDFIPWEGYTIFKEYEDSSFLLEHVFTTFLDNVKKPTEDKEYITKEKAEAIQSFIFKVKNFKIDKDKKLIICCEDGRSVSGAIAVWAMDWLMSDYEQYFYNINSKITPNMAILNDIDLSSLI